MSEMKPKIKKKRNHGITWRWIAGSLLWTILILIVGVIIISYSFRESYYNQARLSLLRIIEQVYSQVPASYQMDDSGRERALHSLVQDFSERDRFELMTVDTDGNILLTSSGFTYDSTEPMDDFFEAANSASRSAGRIGYALDGEHIISHTRLFHVPINNSIAGIRMVTSLRLVDAQLKETVYLLVLSCILILFFSIFSGVYFIRSIAIPIRSIGNTAKRITGGDYEVRIDNRYNDEIGELCDIINDMAVGLTDADRMKNDFISSVSHELRTPLTSIRGWGETLLTAGAGDALTFEKGMRIITSETDRLSLMVEDLLDFSRLQTGGISIQRVPADIIAELSEVVMVFEKRADGQGIEIIYNEPEESEPVFADRNRIRQVFSNLFDNAIKYTKRGGSISILVSKDDLFVTITVKDTGIGIPEDEVDRITEKFYRAKNSLPGSGIGLAVVNEIVSLHDGKLKVESELGKGTAISVSLPVLTY